VNDSYELVEMSEVREKADGVSHEARLEAVSNGSGGPSETEGVSHMMRGWRSRSIKKLLNNSPRSPR
jgi:hypothetical protein